MKCVIEVEASCTSCNRSPSTAHNRFDRVEFYRFLADMKHAAPCARVQYVVSMEACNQVGVYAVVCVRRQYECGQMSG